MPGIPIPRVQLPERSVDLRAFPTEKEYLNRYYLKPRNLSHDEQREKQQREEQAKTRGYSCLYAKAWMLHGYIQASLNLLNGDIEKPHSPHFAFERSQKLDPYDVNLYLA